MRIHLVIAHFSPATTGAPACSDFLMVDKVIKGEGTLQLAQRMQLGKNGWIAVPGVQ